MPIALYIFLNGGADDVGYRAMIAEIDHIHPVPDEFQVDRVDRAVVTITNRELRSEFEWAKALLPRANNKSGIQENRKTDEIVFPAFLLP